MKKWIRANYMPNKPLYEGKNYVTSSEDHLNWSRVAAREGMVLLKNEKDLLPLLAHDKGQKVRLATFGKGLFDYVKGGGGSGDVTVSYVHNLYDGLSSYKDRIVLYEPLVDYYRAYVTGAYAEGALPGLLAEPDLEETMIRASKECCDVALITISRFSGEGWDRKSVYYDGQEPSEARQSRDSEAVFGESDYYLTDKEKALIDKVKAVYDQILVVLNVGGMMDTSWFVKDDSISSVLLAWQGGMEGGMAMADLLVGEATPSGRLPDTLAASLEAYPSTASFHRSPAFVEYEEDIYVGYRYFYTIPGKAMEVNYPFGYGLSYTTFDKRLLSARVEDDTIYATVCVVNTGSRKGKEVVQLYIQAPDGRLGKARRVLAAFDKTEELSPGERAFVTCAIPYGNFASYDDLGHVAKSAWILEEGSYGLCLGLLEEPCFTFILEGDRILSRLSEKCAPCQLPWRMRSDGSRETLVECQPADYMENILGWSDEPTEGVMPAIRGRGRRLPGICDPDHINLIDVYEGRRTMEELAAKLTDLQLAELLGGQPNMGIANTYGFGNLPEYGIPNLMTTDGPAGVRILPDYEIYTTAWPCSTLLASTWDRKLLYKMGVMAAEEVKENNLSVWLAPAVNIHRSPLCGRNFEYYSEDPILAGELAASLILGVQSLGVGATVKHFACNNKETNRKDSDSRVSERALREIYIKQFEIIIKKARPWAVMSAYNLINGIRASENKELLEDILRGEWGYDGIVCSDWYTHGEHYKELLAGNDIKMGCGYPDRLLMALEKGAITREDLERSAKRLLRMIMKAD